MVVKSIKTNKELSFGRMIDEGKTKEEICKLKNLTPEAYEKAHDSLMKIREEKRKATDNQKVDVTIEGRKGMYHIDTGRREFQSTDNPEDKIPFDTDEPILITSFTCQKCGKVINKLNFTESGTYDFKEDDYVPEKLAFSCPHCCISIDKALLKTIGVSE